jgi:hypothetical protein
LDNFLGVCEPDARRGADDEDFVVLERHGGMFRCEKQVLL